MITVVEEAIMFSKIFSGEWVACSWSQKCGTALNFPGRMTHHLLDYAGLAIWV